MAISKINTRALANDSVTTDKVADNAITTDMVASGEIGVTDLADGSITNAKISATAAIAPSKIDMASVTALTMSGHLSGDTATFTGDIAINNGSPELYFGTTGNHYNWMLAAQENLDQAFEISVGSQDTDYSNDTYSKVVTVKADGNMDLVTGGLKVGGTTVIDSSRNATLAKINTTKIGDGDAGVLFNSHGGGDLDAILPFDFGNDSLYNGHVDIGGASNKFKDLHMSGVADVGSVEVGGTTVINSSQVGFLNEKTRIGTGATYPTDNAQLYIQRANNNPYIGFFSNDGSRNAYLQSVGSGAFYLNNDEGGGWIYQTTNGDVLTISDSGGITSTSSTVSAGHFGAYTASTIENTNSNHLVVSGVSMALKTGTGVARIEMYNSSASDTDSSELVFKTGNNATASEQVRLTKTGTLKIGSATGTGVLSVTNNNTNDANVIAGFQGTDVNQRLLVCNFLCGSDEDRVGLQFENQGTINMRVFMGDDGKLYSKSSNPTADNDGNRFIQNTSNYTIDFNSQKSDTNQPTGNTSGNYWKLGNWTGAGGGDSLRIEIDSTSGYSYNAKPAGTTIINYTRTNGGSASNAVEGGYYATSANSSPVVHDVVYVQISSTEYEIYVKAAGYAELAPFARTNGNSRFTPGIVNTGSTSRPNNSYSGMGTIMYQSVGNATNDMTAPTRVGFSSTGNIIMSNGSGIDFSATPNGPASVTSELLDFYEEGTWSPKISGNSGAFSQTYSQQSGRYTRVGNFVYMTYDVHLTDAGSPQGTYMVLGNLPFTPMSGNHGGSLNVTYYSGWQNLSTSHIGGYIGGSNAYLTNGSNDYIRVADGNHSATSRLIGSGWFMVA